MKKFSLFILTLAVAVNVFAQNSKHNVVPEKGYIPDAETAVRIAEAVWLPIYGAKINENKPFKAKLVKDVWTVEGTMPKNMVGGTPVIEISQKTGTILRVSHGK